MSVRHRLNRAFTAATVRGPSGFSRSPQQQTQPQQQPNVVYPLVPSLMQRLCTFLLDHGLEQEGLFRVSGSHSAIRALRETLDTDASAPLTLAPGDTTPAAIHNVAGVLTSYLREQPRSLLPFALLHEFVAALPPPPQQQQSSSADDVVAPLRTVLAKIPLGFDRLVLRSVLHLLHSVHLKREINKMGATNLGVVFGPTLLRDEDPSELSMLLNTDCVDVVAAIVEHFPALFPEGPPSPVELAAPPLPPSRPALAPPAPTTPAPAPPGLVHRSFGSVRTTSASATHRAWFGSFPGVAATQSLLSQAEAAAATQLNQQSAAEGGDSGESAEAKLRKANIALSTIVMKLVEVVREKAALEEENDSLRARLAVAEEAASSASVARAASGRNPTASTPAAAAAASSSAAAAPPLALDDPIQAEATRVAQSLHKTGKQPVLDPGMVLGRLAMMRDGINAAIDLALPQNAYASLPRVEEMVRRSGQMVANVAGGEVNNLLGEASDQLHTASLQLARTNAAIRLSVAAEVGAAARFMVSTAIGEAPPDTSFGQGTLGMTYATVRGPSESSKKSPRPALPATMMRGDRKEGAAPRFLPF